MPPAISDDEDSASESEIPFKTPAKDEEVEEENGDAEENGADDEDAEDTYVVEKIMSHRFENGTVMYEIKWLGYEKKADRTWEPESNLEGAQESLKAYFKQIGGRPQVPSAKDKKRKISEAASSTPTGSGTTGRGRKKAKSEEGSGLEAAEDSASTKGKAKEWQPPKGSWEEEVMQIDTVEEPTNPKTGKKERVGYVIWNDGKKTQHPLRVINQKCPQKMLAYYEQHLVFKGADEVGGAADV
ncbi:hypothetical protein H2201_006927 [Coniosporium apollinis]|uniref:Chromo domain-containing protein n=2 Tax=Coniosporium TaxID=2810619 RepID=A0ABQ9NMB0_9PEZI|nr:hypothetical protein H2199_005842 [Cladosporium sp. JES 115]KAJ9660505.1 hypothetical protein H2201_006927 [Coniosporium apollinis]